MTPPTLVVLSATHAVVYHGRTPIATYAVTAPLSAEDVEAIRVSDLPIEELLT